MLSAALRFVHVRNVGVEILGVEGTVDRDRINIISILGTAIGAWYSLLTHSSVPLPPRRLQPAGGSLLFRFTSQLHRVPIPIPDYFVYDLNRDPNLASNFHVAYLSLQNISPPGGCLPACH